MARKDGHLQEAGMRKFEKDGTNFRTRRVGSAGRNRPKKK